jgi:hypothetical protein
MYIDIIFSFFDDNLYIITYYVYLYRYTSKKDSGVYRDNATDSSTPGYTDTWAVSPSATSRRPPTYTDNKQSISQFENGYSDSQSGYGYTDEYPEYDTNFPTSDKGKSRKSKAKSAGLASLSSSRRYTFEFIYMYVCIYIWIWIFV